MSYPARRVPLTARELDAAAQAADPSRDVLIYVGVPPGLALRVRHGNAVFVFRWEVDGRSHQTTLGPRSSLSLSAARAAARVLWREWRVERARRAVLGGSFE